MAVWEQQARQQQAGPPQAPGQGQRVDRLASSLRAHQQAGAQGQGQLGAVWQQQGHAQGQMHARRPLQAVQDSAHVFGWEEEHAQLLLQKQQQMQPGFQGQGGSGPQRQVAHGPSGADRWRQLLAVVGMLEHEQGGLVRGQPGHCIASLTEQQSKHISRF